MEFFVISVMLQPFDYDPQEKNKHKFMVQTMFAPDGPIESQEQLVSVSKMVTNYLKTMLLFNSGYLLNNFHN